MEGKGCRGKQGEEGWGAGVWVCVCVIEGQSVGDEGLKLIWINTNTSSPPPQTSNLNRDQLAAPVTMTTSVNHTVAVGFPMGADGDRLGIAAQTSARQAQLAQLTNGYKHWHFSGVNMSFHTLFTGKWQQLRLSTLWWEHTSCRQLAQFLVLKSASDKATTINFSSKPVFRLFENPSRRKYRAMVPKFLGYESSCKCLSPIVNVYNWPESS